MPQGPLVRHLRDKGNIDLFRKAVAEEWPIDAEKRSEIVDALMGDIRNGTPKERADAAKILLGARDNDRKLFLEHLKVMQSDQQFAHTHFDKFIEGSTSSDEEKRIEEQNLSLEEVHELVERNEVK